MSRRATASPLLPDADTALAFAGAGRWSIDGARLTTDDTAARLLGLPARTWPLAQWLDSLARPDADRLAAALDNAASPLEMLLHGGAQPMLLRGAAGAAGWQGIVMPMPAAPEATGALSARDEFVAGISHELRTPLNAIVGFARLARVESAALAESRHLDHIDQSAQLMLRVVNDLLDLARLEAGKLDIEPDLPLDLASLASRVLALAAALRQDKPIRLYTVLDPAIPTRLRGDALRLEQVLVNLAGNAMKFTDRGMVVIGAKLRARRGDLVTLRLSVSDTGVGIPLDRLDRIGRPFERAGPPGHAAGTGLGLAVVRRLLELHGTQMKMASVAGGGTICWFDLTLPLDPTAEPAPTVADTVVFSADRRLLDTVATLWQTQGHRLLPTAAADGASRWVVDSALPESAARIEEAHRQGRRLHVVSAGPVGRDGSVVTLPLLLTAAFEPARPAPLRPDPQLAGRRLLVVEDNAFNQQVLAGLLHHLGAEAVLCSDGRSALARLAETPFDAALLDIQLGAAENGFDVARALRARPEGAALPLLFLSAHLDPTDRMAAAALGALGCLPKPYEAEALQALLRPLPRRAGSAAPPPLAETPSMRRLFAAVWPAQHAALRDAADAGALRAAVHALRGSLAMLGERDAIALARTVEEGLAAGRPAAALPLPDLIRAAEALARA